MREFRFLDEKRKTNGLTQVEEQRWQELGASLGIDLSAAMQPSAKANLALPNLKRTIDLSPPTH